MGPRISFLGGYALHDAVSAPVRLPTRKSWGLLAYLAMSKGRDIPREELAALLWPRSSDTNARASLRQELAVLRKKMVAAGLPEFQGTKETVRLAVSTDQVDALKLARLVAEKTPEAARKAVAFYKGDFLSGLNIASHQFEDWLWVERQRLKALALNAYLDLLDIDTDAADTDRAIATATALLAVDPTQEAGHRALMRIYRRIGRRAEALQQFQRCAGILERELDTEPSHDTIELANRIRADLEGPLRNGTDAQAGLPQVRPMRAPAKPGVQTLIVMNARLAGIEALYARVDPRLLADAQDRFAALATHRIAKAGGQVLGLSGDSVVACFGYPELGASDLDRAIGAAQAIAARLFDLTEDSALIPRIGIARGKVLLRDDGHGGAQIIGIPVRQAQILAQSGRGGDVVISADLRSRIGMAFETDDIPVAASRDDAASDRGYLVRFEARRG